ncbi:hypothetical protein BKA69DRAFT_1035234 [Paraphysoderma sedebokerense]|nr:hypothetical protein BKA69DRAFT_1035234 [Paraphysoderma sedebokerense]
MILTFSLWIVSGSETVSSVYDLGCGSCYGSETSCSFSFFYQEMIRKKMNRTVQCVSLISLQEIEMRIDYDGACFCEEEILTRICHDYGFWSENACWRIRGDRSAVI